MHYVPTQLKSDYRALQPRLNLRQSAGYVLLVRLDGQPLLVRLPKSQLQTTDAVLIVLVHDLESEVFGQA